MGTITERDRMALHQWADERMGEQNADTLMKSLPPAGWGDVATKDDLEALRADTKSELRAAIEELREFIKQQVEALEVAWRNDAAAATAQQRSYTDRQAFRLVIVFPDRDAGRAPGSERYPVLRAAAHPAHATDAGHPRLPRSPGLAVQTSAMAGRGGDGV